MNALARLLAALLLFVGCATGTEGLRAAPPAPASVAAPLAAPGAEARIPPEARRVLAYIREHRAAPPNHVGGRRFGNFEGRLPKLDARGRRIAYQEWDVFPKVPGRSRGTHRLVTGSDGRAWYTADHYESFTELKEPR
jgi:guanyl-specific ribonuclease Sa